MKNKNYRYFSSKEGITLIALIITIVVMIILAGVTIFMLFGDKGVVTNATEAAEEKRAAEVEEYRDLWKNSLEINYYNPSEEVQSLEELLDKLLEKDLLTKDEVEHILEKGWVKIASREIVFFDRPQIGDFVDYEYSDEEPIKVGEIEGLYDYRSRPEFEQIKNIKWKVLYEKGSKIYITPYDTDDDIVMENTVMLQGIEAFNSLNYVLDGLCEKFYSNESLGLKARSLSLYDLENLLTEEGKKAKNEHYENPDRYVVEKYPKVLDYPNYQTQKIYNGINSDVGTGPKEVIQDFDYKDKSFFSEKAGEVIFDSPYVNKFKEYKAGMGCIIAGRNVSITYLKGHSTAGFIEYGLVFLYGERVEQLPICYSYMEDTSDILAEGSMAFSNPSGLIPVIEIDLLKYRIVDNDENVHTGNDTFDNSWKIEKIRK